MNMNADVPQSREVGMTLVCPHCDLAVVVLDRGAPDETLMCHTTMTPARPVPCWRGDPPPAGAATVAGALYADEQSSLTVRCTRPGAGALRCAGRRLSLATAQQP